MGDYQDYAFVTQGNKRQEILKSLYTPRRAKELVKEQKLHFSVVSKILRQLSAKELVESYSIKGKKYYRLTQRGETIRRIILS